VVQEQWANPLAVLRSLGFPATANNSNCKQLQAAACHRDVVYQWQAGNLHQLSIKYTDVTLLELDIAVPCLTPQGSAFICWSPAIRAGPSDIQKHRIVIILHNFLDLVLPHRIDT